MNPLDPQALADELSTAYAARRTDIVPPSARDAAFDLAAGYAVEAELVRRRQASGHATVGRKVGFANKALWRRLKLETLVWASMYDDPSVSRSTISQRSTSHGCVLRKSNRRLYSR
jgi:2-keto-4-pentenoate hydratase